MAELNAAQEDRHLRKSLGLWQLTAIGFSGVIGSGWLLGAMVAAQIAGPEAIVAWPASPQGDSVFAQRPDPAGHTIRGMSFLAPAAFVLASMILYWATWKELRIALPVLLVGALVYAVQQYRQRNEPGGVGGVDWLDVRVGLWLVAYLVAILVVSAIGSKDFGGANWIPAPWDSILVAVIGVVGYEWGVRDAVRHLTVHPARSPRAPTRTPTTP